MPLTLRNVKGSKLTHTELDGNFQYLESLNSALPPVTITTNTTLVAADHANRLLICNSASPITLTLSNDATGGWANDDSINAIQYGAGSVSIEGGTATLRVVSGVLSVSSAQYRVVAAVRVGTSEWVPTELSASGNSGSTYAFDGGTHFAIFPSFQNSSTLNYSGLGFNTETASFNGVNSFYNSVTEYSSQIRIGLTSTTATANSKVGVFTAASNLMGNSGFVSEFVFGIADDIVSGSKTIVGLIPQVGGVDGVSEPSVNGDTGVFIFANSSDSQFRLAYGSSGARTIVALNGGVGFPCNGNANTTGDFYKFKVKYYPTSAPGGKRIEWLVKNLSTGVEAEGVITSANVPSLAGGSNGYRHYIVRNNGVNAIAPRFDIIRIAGGGHVQ
jgi:hypothetical protein